MKWEAAGFRVRLLVGLSTLVCVLGGCSDGRSSSPSSPATQVRLTGLGEVGAQSLANQGGKNLLDRCSRLPLPDTVVLVGCANWLGRSVSEADLEPGRYAVVLLCDGAQGVTYSDESTAPLFESTSVECAKGTDVSAAILLSVSSARHVKLSYQQQGEGTTASVLVRIP